MLNARQPDTSRVIVTGRCFGKPVTQPTASPPEKKDTVKKETRIIIRDECCYGNSQPLIVMDGNFCNGRCLIELKPADIDSIWVMRGAEAAAIFGCKGHNGALIITTKKSYPYKLFIKDAAGGSFIPGAKVVLTPTNSNKNMELKFVANDSGYICSKDLPFSNEYTVSVSALGYSRYQGPFNYIRRASEIKITLEKDFKLTAPPRVKAINQNNPGCTLFYDGEIDIPADILTDKIITPDLASSAISIYPNPIQKGAALSLQIRKSDHRIRELRITNATGTVMLRQQVGMAKQEQRIQLQTNPGWLPGVYFLQVICENGCIPASEKIIIQ
jgi:TonB-dependent SusC/RagA subfamily outer membrane receptor